MLARPPECRHQGKPRLKLGLMLAYALSMALQKTPSRALRVANLLSVATRKPDLAKIARKKGRRAMQNAVRGKKL